MKKKYTYNKTFFLWVIFSALMLNLVGVCLAEQDFWWGVFCGVIALLGIFVGLLTPWRNCFDPEGLTICYAFLPNERYLWENIHSVFEKEDSHKTTLLSPLFFTVYEIGGIMEGKEYFYMNGYLYKSVRAKRLLMQYWDGEIEGNLLQDIKKWWNRKAAKKQKQIKQHLTDEIVPLEREIRARARACIKPHLDQARQRNLSLRYKFLYRTGGLEELQSRPKEAYTYSLLIELSRPDEQDEEKILCFSADLLFVRLGHTAYKGAEKKGAMEELFQTLEEALENWR